MEDLDDKPEVKGVDTSELDAQIARIISERPNFHFSVRELTEKDYKLIYEAGLSHAFGSSDALAAFIAGTRGANKAATGRELPGGGEPNVKLELRRIAHWLERVPDPRAPEWQEEDLVARQAFLRTRFDHIKNKTGIKKRLLDECVQKGYIAAEEQRSWGRGLCALCVGTSTPRVADIIWAMYKREKTEFDGRKRVPFFEDEHPDEDTPVAARPASGSAVDPPLSARARTQPARTQPKRIKVSPAPRPEAEPVEVLSKTPTGRGHQYLCKMKSGSVEPLPAKPFEKQHPELVAAFNQKDSARGR